MDGTAVDFAQLATDVAPWTLAAVYAAVIFAGLVHGTLGLGFPLVSTPLIALVLDVRAAILLTLLPTAAVNLATIVHVGQWRATVVRFWPLVAAGALGAVAGTAVLTALDPEPFRLLLAALIVGYLLVSGRERSGGARLAAAPATSMLAFGVAAGFAAGTTNVMVPVLIVYALEAGLARDGSVRLFNLCFLAGKLAQIATFAIAGVLGAALLGHTTPLALAAVGALLVGTRLRERVPAETYRRILRVLLGLLAAVLAAQFAISL